MAKISDRQMAAFKKLGYSDAQIEEMIEDDKAVDRGEPLPWDMSKDEHKKAMKYANADEHKKAEKKQPTVYTFDTTNRPEKRNATKEQLITAINNFLIENKDELGCDNVAITNKQGKVEFTIGEISFSLSLTQHRKK